MTELSIPRIILKEKRANAPDGMAHCRLCDNYKSRDDFYKHLRSRSGISGACKACESARDAISERRKKQQRAYEASPEVKARRAAYEASSKRRKRGRATKVQGKYDITNGDYARMLAHQNGMCAICGRPETAAQNGTPRRLAIDHNHDTGVVRGLLCTNCNLAIGLFRDNIDTLSSAIDYLIRTNT